MLEKYWVLKTTHYQGGLNKNLYRTSLPLMLDSVLRYIDWWPPKDKCELVFSCELLKTFTNTSFTEHVQAIASEHLDNLDFLCYIRQ